MIDNNHALQIKQLYQSTEYAIHSEERNVYFKGHQVQACEAQSEIVLEYLSQSNPINILDIGCFDGSLLGAFERLTKTDRLVGYDLEARPSFKENCSGIFTSKPIELIDQKFDLIILSQSLIYIEDLKSLFINISKLLNKDGYLFIHIPNILKRPSMLFLADQYHYFSPNTLDVLCSFFGFRNINIESSIFEKDILVIGQKYKRKNSRQCRGILDSLLVQVDNFREKILAVRAIYKNIWIFGTTMEAAFAESICETNIRGFIDEDPKRIGKTFHEKPIIHPKSLDTHEVCLLPYFSSFLKLKSRLNNEYSANFILLD